MGEACGIPIAAGENCCFASQFAALLDARAVQYAQPSVTKVGGITEFLKVADLVREPGRQSSRRTRRTSAPGALATLHLLAAAPEAARFEYFYCWPDAWLYGEALAPKRGKLAVREGPGAGLRPGSRGREALRGLALPRHEQDHHDYWRGAA